MTAPFNRMPIPNALALGLPLHFSKMQSGSFSQDLVEKKQRTSQCSRCKKVHSAMGMFYWSSCCHCYCVQCTLCIINDSLSLLNRTPKCIFSECNHSLDILHAQSIPMEARHCLLPKYQLIRSRMSDALQYNYLETLMAGYIRIESRSECFPVDVAMIIFDFCELLYYTKTQCHRCKSLGVELVDCSQCRGVSSMIKCADCNAKGLTDHLLQCRKCKGTGDYVKDYICRRCDGLGADGHGHCYHCLGRGYLGPAANPCLPCNGSGKARHCRKCGGTGLYRHRGHKSCRNCKGSGKIKRKIICHSCKGEGWNRQDPSKCSLCKGTSKIQTQCRICEGNKVTMALDFTKLCNKQSLCSQCNLFFPNDQMMHWSGCHHPVCLDCVRTAIRGQKYHHQHPLRIPVPVCSVAGCEEKLTLKTLNRIPGTEPHGHCPGCKHYVPATMLVPWSSCGHPVCSECAVLQIQTTTMLDQIATCPVDGCCAEITMHTVNTTILALSMTGHLKARLQTLIDRKSMFRCAYCLQWHPNDLRMAEGPWTRQCVELHSNHGYCTSCNARYPKSETMQWPYCRHRICDDCVLNRVCYHIIQMEEIPTCSAPDCTVKLTVDSMDISPLCHLTGLKEKLESHYEGRQMRAENKFKCLRCGEPRDNELRVRWSTECGHSFCVECVLKTIDHVIPREPPPKSLILNLKLPRCKADGGRCPVKLGLEAATLKFIGATDFQIQYIELLENEAEMRYQ